MLALLRRICIVYVKLAKKDLCVSNAEKILNVSTAEKILYVSTAEKATPSVTRITVQHNIGHPLASSLGNVTFLTFLLLQIQFTTTSSSTSSQASACVTLSPFVLL